MDLILSGRTLVDREGSEVGTITDVISDSTTLEPEWLIVRTGRIRGEHLVPVQAIETIEDETVVVPFRKDQVDHAPRAKDHTGPSTHEREALLGHYGMSIPRRREGSLRPSRRRPTG